MLLIFNMKGDVNLWVSNINSYLAVFFEQWMQICKSVLSCVHFFNGFKFLRCIVIVLNYSFFSPWRHVFKLLFFFILLHVQSRKSSMNSILSIAFKASIKVSVKINKHKRNKIVFFFFLVFNVIFSFVTPQLHYANNKYA